MAGEVRAPMSCNTHHQITTTQPWKGTTLRKKPFSLSIIDQTARVGHPMIIFQIIVSFNFIYFKKEFLMHRPMLISGNECSMNDIRTVIINFAFPVNYIFTSNSSNFFVLLRILEIYELKLFQFWNSNNKMKRIYFHTIECSSNWWMNMSQLFSLLFSNQIYIDWIFKLHKTYVNNWWVLFYNDMCKYLLYRSKLYFGTYQPVSK